MSSFYIICPVIMKNPKCRKSKSKLRRGCFHYFDIKIAKYVDMFGIFLKYLKVRPLCYLYEDLIGSQSYPSMLFYMQYLHCVIEYYAQQTCFDMFALIANLKALICRPCFYFYLIQIFGYRFVPLYGIQICTQQASGL